MALDLGLCLGLLLFDFPLDLGFFGLFVGLLLSSSRSPGVADQFGVYAGVEAGWGVEDVR